VKLAAAATKAACIDIQLTQERDGKDQLPASNVFTAPEIETLEALCPTLEGKTVRQQNLHPLASLAWAACQKVACRSAQNIFQITLWLPQALLTRIRPISISSGAKIQANESEAPRTRSRASPTALSGRPTTRKVGTPAEICTCTSTGTASMPANAKDWMRAMTGMAVRAFRGWVRTGWRGGPV